MHKVYLQFAFFLILATLNQFALAQDTASANKSKRTARTTTSCPEQVPIEKLNCIRSKNLNEALAGRIISCFEIRRMSEPKKLDSFPTKTHKEVVVAAPKYPRRWCPGTPVTKIKSYNSSSSKETQQFTLYPNPVSKCSIATFTTTSLTNGTYKLVVTDNTARTLLTKQITVPNKQVKEQIPIAHTWAAGMYVLNLLDENGKQVYTTKFLVQ